MNRDQPEVTRYTRPYPRMTDRAAATCCRAIHFRDGWACTRPDGHEGRHEAGTAGGAMLASWVGEAPDD